MGNRVVIFEDQDELQHYGVLGMKWGVRKADRRTTKTSKKVRKTTKRFDKGKNPDTTKVSKRVRKQKYKVDRKIQRAERVIAKISKANAREVINRYNRNPDKKAAIEDYVKSMQINSQKLAELRMQLIDIRI